MLLCPPVRETKHTKCETKRAKCFYTFSLGLAVSMQLLVLTNRCGHRTLRLSWITFSAPFLPFFIVFLIQILCQSVPALLSSLLKGLFLPCFKKQCLN